MRTLTMVLLGVDFWQANMPARWKIPMAPEMLAEAMRKAKGHPCPAELPCIDHVALVDALHQGCWFAAMMWGRRD